MNPPLGVIDRIPEVQSLILDAMFLDFSAKASYLHWGIQSLAQRIISRCDFQTGMVLDMGCGCGTYTQALAIYASKQDVIGLDINPYAIDLANKKKSWEIKNVEFVQGDVYNLQDYYGKCDLVTAFSTLHHFDDLASALGQIYSSLTKGGIFYSDDFLPTFEIPDKIALPGEQPLGASQAMRLLRKTRTDEECVKLFLEHQLVIGIPEEEQVKRLLLISSYLAAYTPGQLESELKNAGFKLLELTVDESNYYGYVQKH